MNEGQPLEEKGFDRQSYLARVQSADPTITNMVCFDHAVCVVLRELFHNFPHSVTLDVQRLVKDAAIPDACRPEMGPMHPANRQNVINSTIDFLAREGFIVMPGGKQSQSLYPQVALTMRGLAALRSTPASLDLPSGKSPLGEQLAKDFASAAVSALVTTILATFIATR
jgi:hypothetical protein